MGTDAPENVAGDVGQLRLTYAQLSKRLGISGEAVRILVRRRGWFRIIPNTKGQPTVVVVPSDELVAEQERRTQSPDDGATPADAVTGGLSGAIALLDRTLSRLVEAERRADDALQSAERAEAAMREARASAQSALAQAQATAKALLGERTRAEQAELAQDRLGSELESEKKARAEAEGALAELRSRSEDLTVRLTDAESRAERGLAAAKEAREVAEARRQAEAERKARGRWSRLRAAWRGE